MKILYIIDSFKAGGKERQLAELLKSFKTKDSINIQLVVLSDSIEYDYVNRLNIDIHILNRKYKKDLSIFRKLNKICAYFKPDIIHSWELMCSIYSLPIARLNGIKFINGVIRSAPSEFNILSKKWFPMKLTFLFSNIVLGNSHAGLMSFNAPDAKSYYIHNGFDFGRIENIKSADHIKRKHNISTKYVVGMVARFNKDKDYYSYIKSAMNILDKRKDVSFVAVGGGETFSECVELVSEKYRKHILFLGKQSDVESIINIFDIGVLASKNEGISNSIMEYMALGKPVIANMNRGNEEIVLNGMTGFLVRHNDVAELTEKIEYLLENREVAMTMGKAGRERLEKEFDIEGMTYSHIKLYENLLNKQDNVRIHELNQNDPR